MIVLIDYENTGNVVDLVYRKPINFIYHGRVLNFSDEIIIIQTYGVGETLDKDSGLLHSYWRPLKYPTNRERVKIIRSLKAEIKRSN